MERKIWCHACAASMRLSEEDSENEWGTVRWGYVWEADITCDECGCELPAGSFASCVRHHRGMGEYRPWEGRFVVPRKSQDADLEQGLVTEALGRPSYVLDTDACDLAHREPPARDRPLCSQSGSGAPRQSKEDRPDSNISFHEATGAAVVASTPLVISVALATAAGVVLGLALSGG